jgi:tetratricopeptide (TPR) repeat protein
LRAACALFVLTIASHAAYAAAGDAARFFQAGRLAFEAQNYAAALAAFEAALAAKLQGPAVNFNIGVAAYRLGRYERAEIAFLEVARTPSMAALAHYNLGLVALRRGDSDAAASWFARAEHEADDERLRALATTQLAALPAPPVRNWVGYAAFNAGYDDNVALVANSNVLGVSGVDDAFAEAQLALSTPLDQPWRLDVGLVHLDYQELDQFDQIVAQGGGRYFLGIGRWRSEIAAQLAYTTLDGEGFENRRMLSLQTSTQLRAHWRLRGRYRFSDIDGMNEFTGMGGYRNEASAQLGWERAPWNVGAEYQWSESSLHDDALSATRHQLTMSVERTVDDAWTLAFEIARRHSRYQIESNGAENRTALALAATRTLNARWRLVARYEYSDNEADLPEFNYQRTRLYAGVEAIM